MRPLGGTSIVSATSLALFLRSRTAALEVAILDPLSFGLDPLRRCRIARKQVATVPKISNEPARTFAIDAARLAADTRCSNVVVLDVTGISPVCDYFIIATGTSARQMRSVGQDIIDLAVSRNFAPMNRSALNSDTWILVDCVDVVVHVFSEEARHYYDLDNLWGDAKRVDWQRSGR